MPEFDKKVKDHVIKGIHTGQYTPYKLPSVVYAITADKLNTGIHKGFGKMIGDIKFNTTDYKLVQSMRTNIYMFSAAKTFKMTKEMSELLLDGNRRVSYQEFITRLNKYGETVPEIFDRYNENWLKSEYETAQSMADNARIWTKAEERKEALPYLIYSGAEDEVECDICAPLDGITLPIGDPFWDENTPPNHFNCRCTVESAGPEEEDNVATIDESESAEEQSKSGGKDKLFDNNPGKTGIIFKDKGAGKHPYFEVTNKDRAFALNNFGLPIPNDPNKL